jgi:DNA helicase II / ATP-dependent DNA helicase PcrA
MAIVDYKTATDPDTAAYEFQLAIYAAAGRAEGLRVRGAYVHDLADGERKPVSIDEDRVAQAKSRAEGALTRIAGGEFPPRKGPHCAGCDVHLVCGHGTGS